MLFRAMRCPTCGQENLKSALVCEFCKELLSKKPPPRLGAAPQHGAAPGRGGWSTPIVCAVALVSAGLGFAAHGLFTPARTEPAAITAAPPPPPSAKPAVLAPVAVEKMKPDDAPLPKPVEAAVAPAAVPPPEVLAPSPAPAPPAPAAPELKRITVRYEHLEGLAQRIIIPVTINGRGPVKMALDTGAPITVLSSHLAAKLGVLREGDARLLTLAGGIGGTTPAALVVLDSIAVGEATSDFIPATVTDESLSDAWEGLVGMDFLAGYSVSIDTAQHVLVLTEQPPRTNAPAGHDETWWRRTFQVLAGQRTTWKSVRTALEEHTAKSEVSAGGDAETIKKLLTFAQAQDREAEALTSRLERYASTHSVPLEWRKP